MNVKIDHLQRRLIQSLVKPLKIKPGDCQVRYSSMAVKAVIFDIYGTLLYSAADEIGAGERKHSGAAFVAALADGGWFIEPKRLAAAGETMVQEAIAQSHRKSRDDGNNYPEVDIIHIWKEILDRLDLLTGEPDRIKLTAISYECRTNPVWPMPGLQQVLERLAAASLKLGILSNAQFYTPVLLETLLERPLALFTQDLILWSYQEMTAKPSASLFEKMNARLLKDGIQPGEVAYVGNDLHKDVSPASAMGWRTILFAGDCHTHGKHKDGPSMANAEPDMVINDIRQLIEIFL